LKKKIENSFALELFQQKNATSHYMEQDIPSAHEEVARKKAKRCSTELSLDAHTTIKLEKLEGVSRLTL